jgi:hypothetical protein
MLFIALETGIMSEEAKEYLYLKRTIELKKLRRQVAEEEELEKQYITSQQKRLPVEVADSGNNHAQGNQQQDQEPVSRSGDEDIDVLDQFAIDQVQRQGNCEGGLFTDFHNEHEDEEGLEGDDYSQDRNDFDGAAGWYNVRDVDVNARGHEGQRLSHRRRHLATWSQGAAQGGGTVGCGGPHVAGLGRGRGYCHGWGGFGRGWGGQSWVGKRVCTGWGGIHSG